jgi:hypothetical protein
MTLILNRRTLICLQRYNKGRILSKALNIDSFARYGHLSLIILYNNTPSVICTTNAMNWASENGYRDVVKWLHENRNEGCTKSAMNWASINGHLDVVQFLHFNRNEGCTTLAMDWAIANALRTGHCDIVKFLKQHYPQYFIVPQFA